MPLKYMVWNERGELSLLLLTSRDTRLFYLHQLCKKVHGYGGASVEEHGRSSQEAWEGTGDRTDTTVTMAKIPLSWKNRASPAINAWSSSSMFRIQRNKQLVTWAKENQVNTTIVTMETGSKGSSTLYMLTKDPRKAPNWKFSLL